MSGSQSLTQQSHNVLSLVPDDSPDRVACLYKLGIQYRDTYEITGSPTDFEAAIVLLQKSSDLVKDGDTHQACCSFDLGLAYSLKFRKTGAVTDVETAIDKYQTALELLPNDDSDRGIYIHNLSLGHRSKYKRTGVMADLETAIQLCQKSLDYFPEVSPERAGCLQSLGTAYSDKAQRTGLLSFFETATQFHQEAVDITLPNDPNRAHRLLLLGSAYRERSRRMEETTGLDTAIKLSQEALHLIPHDHPERPYYLHFLSVSHIFRYDRTATKADFDTAMELSQEALDLTSDDSPERPGHLAQFGNLYYTRYERTGSLADLDLAIDYHQEAVNRIPYEHPRHAEYLTSLAIGYNSRYQEIKAVADLEMAHIHCQKALDLTPNDHTDRIGRLRTLGKIFQDKHHRNASFADLETSIMYHREALSLVPDDHPNRVPCLTDLGVAYSNRYQFSRGPADLTSSVELFQEALESTPNNHPDRAGLFQNLAVGYGNRYHLSRKVEDINLAINYNHNVLELTPPDHPARAARLQNIGIVYMDRYDTTRETADLEAAIEHWRAAVSCSSSPVWDRFPPGRILIMLFADAQNWQSAYDIAHATISLIPSLTSRFLKTSDAQFLFDRVANVIWDDFASDAAAVAIKANQSPHDAVWLLELGRDLITGPLKDMRADISELRLEHPELAAQLESLRDQLGTPITSTDADGRYKITRNFEMLVKDIRQLHGFHQFLSAPDESEIRNAAADGPIVILNASKYSCDAIIIEKTASRTLNLPHLRYGDLHIKAAALDDPESIDADLLEGLWDTIAEPVLEALGLHQTPSDVWPHLWWIPLGLLTKFPIHAAGRHTDGSLDTVIDRVISSYSSSIRALVHSRKRRFKRKELPELDSLVLLGMETTPGYNALPSVRLEIERLESLCARTQLQVCRPRARRQDVLNAVRDCTIFHFAGHGLANVEDPSESSLMLEDGPLTVTSLFEMNLSHQSFLAYLSACGTGQNRHDGLVDDGLHLVGAFQVAGFRHVIGTLWEVNDESCVDVTIKTYEWIQQHGMSDAAVSEGLHRACRELREQWVSENDTRRALDQPNSAQCNTRDARDAEADDDVPLYWVPYMHFGI